VDHIQDGVLVSIIASLLPQKIHKRIHSATAVVYTLTTSTS